MKGRMQNAMRAMVATMVMTMSAATLANAAAADRSQPSAPRDLRVNARVVAIYDEAAWLAPAVVVLDSKKAWDEWNKNEVDAQRAVGAEAAPTNVDWGRECVMIVALGENVNGRASLDLDTCMRKGTDTEVGLKCSLTSGGTTPALVVALPRGSAHSVKVHANVPLVAMPERATYVMASSNAGDPLPAAVVVSWGSVKADYR